MSMSTCLHVESNNYDSVPYCIVTNLCQLKLYWQLGAIKNGLSIT